MDDHISELLALAEDNRKVAKMAEKAVEGMTGQEVETIFKKVARRAHEIGALPATELPDYEYQWNRILKDSNAPEVIRLLYALWLSVDNRPYKRDSTGRRAKSMLRLLWTAPEWEELGEGPGGAERQIQRAAFILGSSPRTMKNMLPKLTRELKQEQSQVSVKVNMVKPPGKKPNK